MDKAKLGIVLGTYFWLLYLLFVFLRHKSFDSMVFMLIMIGIFCFLNFHESNPKFKMSHKNNLFLFLSSAVVLYTIIKLADRTKSALYDFLKTDNFLGFQILLVLTLYFLYSVCFNIFLVIYPVCRPPFISTRLENRFGKYGELFILTPFVFLLVMYLIIFS